MKSLKKICYCLVLMFSLFAVMNPVFAKNGCEGIGIEIDDKILDVVHYIILIIQIVIPILLVIFGSIDFLKAVVAQKDDEIKKGQQTFIKRIIAAVIVFFVVAIVRLVVSFAADKDDKDTILDCFNCFLDGSESCSSGSSASSGSNDVEYE